MGKPTNVKEKRCSPMSMGRSSLTSMNDGGHKYKIKRDSLVSKRCSPMSKENDVHQFKKRRCTLMSKPSSLGTKHWSLMSK